jgi:hypothetical protein
MISLFNEIKTYLITKYKITRLDITEKIIIGINLVIQVIIIVLLLTVILIVASFTLANYLGNYWDNASLGFLVVSGIDILLLIIFIIFRKILVLKPLSKILIQLLFAGNREEEEEDEEDEI